METKNRKGTLCGLLAAMFLVAALCSVGPQTVASAVGNIERDISAYASIGTTDNPFMVVLDNHGHTLSWSDAKKAVTQISAHSGLELYKDGRRAGLTEEVCTGNQILCLETSPDRMLPIVVKCDILQNGTMSISQLVAAAKALCGETQLSTLAFHAADVDDSGTLSIVDLVLLSQRLLLLENGTGPLDSLPELETTHPADSEGEGHLPSSAPSKPAEEEEELDAESSAVASARPLRPSGHWSPDDMHYRPGASPAPKPSIGLPPASSHLPSSSAGDNGNAEVSSTASSGTLPTATVGSSKGPDSMQSGNEKPPEGNDVEDEGGNVPGGNGSGKEDISEGNEDNNGGMYGDSGEDGDASGGGSESSDGKTPGEGAGNAGVGAGTQDPGEGSGDNTPGGNVSDEEKLPDQGNIDDDDQGTKPGSLPSQWHDKETGLLSKILARLNEIRTEHGLRILDVTDPLTQLAQDNAISLRETAEFPQLPADWEFEGDEEQLCLSQAWGKAKVPAETCEYPEDVLERGTIVDDIVMSLQEDEEWSRIAVVDGLKAGMAMVSLQDDELYVNLVMYGKNEKDTLPIDWKKRLKDSLQTQLIAERDLEGEEVLFIDGLLEKTSDARMTNPNDPADINDGLLEAIGYPGAECSLENIISLRHKASIREFTESGLYANLDYKALAAECLDQMKKEKTWELACSVKYNALGRGISDVTDGVVYVEILLYPEPTWKEEDQKTLAEDICRRIEALRKNVEAPLRLNADLTKFAQQRMADEPTNTEVPYKKDYWPMKYGNSDAEVGDYIVRYEVVHSQLADEKTYILRSVSEGLLSLFMTQEKWEHLTEQGGEYGFAVSEVEDGKLYAELVVSWKEAGEIAE